MKKGGGCILCDTPFTRGEEGIRINGLIWMGNKEEMAERISQKLSQGFNCLKLKIGGIDFEMPFYAIYSGIDQTKIDNYINDNAQIWECGVENVRKNCIGATIGTHVGPGAIGIAFFSK